MLPDGSINPGQMTSFNHYSLVRYFLPVLTEELTAQGSVCAFLHDTVGGLSAGSPGWKTALVRPRPGGTVRYATTAFDSPYGKYSVRWRLDGLKMKTSVLVPPNGQAKVVLNGVDKTVGSGEYEFETEWLQDPGWPPSPIQGPQGQILESYFIE